MTVGVSTLAQALSQVDRIKVLQTKFDTLAEQFTSGKKTQKFSGLGSDALLSQRSRAEFSRLDSYIDTIVNAQRRIELTTNTIEEFKTQALGLYGNLTSLPQESTHSRGDLFLYDDPLTTMITEQTPIGVTSAENNTEFTALLNLADDLNDVFRNLLNTRDGSRYLFAGAGIFTQPLGNAGLLDSKITQLIQDWKDPTNPSTDPTADIISALQNSDSSVDPNAIVDTIVGYSPELSSGNADRIFVKADENTELDYTTLANEQAFRDVVVAVAFLRNTELPPIVDVYEPGNPGPPTAPDHRGAPGVDVDEMTDNFYRVINAVADMLNNALDEMSEQRFEIDNVRARVEEIKIAHEQSQAIQESIISDVENVDLDEVAVRLSNLEVQLDASFRITARIQDLSLVNFL